MINLLDKVMKSCTNKIDDKYLYALKKPFIFAFVSFCLSLITSVFFEGLTCLIAKFLSLAATFFDASTLSFYDGFAFCFITLLYTYKFREKMLFRQLFSISFFLTFFIALRTSVLWFFVNHSTNDFYYILDIMADVIYLLLFFIFNSIGLKLVNIAYLKWFEKKSKFEMSQGE